MLLAMAAEAPLGRRVSRAVRVLAPEGAESNKHLLPESLPQSDWTDQYAKSEAFESEYQSLTDPDDGQKCPNGLTEEEGKLYWNGWLLVPESQVLELYEALHHRLMHPWFKRPFTCSAGSRSMRSASTMPLSRTRRVVRSVRPAILKDRMSGRKPIPDQPMGSVAMDVFSMPEVQIGRLYFNCVVLCVDRHTGYVFAVTVPKRGLLAKGVAAMMVPH